MLCAQVLTPLSWPDLLWVAALPGLSEELLFRGALIPALFPDWCDGSSHRGHDAFYKLLAVYHWHMLSAGSTCGPRVSANRWTKGKVTFIIDERWVGALRKCNAVVPS